MNSGKVKKKKKTRTALWEKFRGKEKGCKGEKNGDSKKPKRNPKYEQIVKKCRKIERVKGVVGKVIRAIEGKRKLREKKDAAENKRQGFERSSYGRGCLSQKESKADNYREMARLEKSVYDTRPEIQTLGSETKVKGKNDPRNDLKNAVRVETINREKSYHSKGAIKEPKEKNKNHIGTMPDG